MTLQDWINKGKPLNSFIHGDCMELMADMPDKFIDLCIVDPPYGIGDFWNKQKHTSHYGFKKWNNKIPNKNYFDELFRISKNQIIWGGNYYCHYLPITNSWIIWDKGNNVEKMNTSECELAWTSFKIPMRKIFCQWSGGRKGNETGNKNIHPCQRPIQLYRWLLQNYAKPGDKIFDSHCGSASSLIACHLEGFDFIGTELDEDYYREAKQRLEAYQMQQNLF